MPFFNYVKSSLSIFDVISDYVQLKQAGNYWKGPCPFHYEKEASFTVSMDKGIFYCFGCHASGDVISFVAKKENLTQLEAAKYLVDKYQLEIPEEIKQNFLKNFDNGSLLKNSYFSVCELFSLWSKTKLLESSFALEYVKSRKISLDLINYFNIGYFPGGIRNIENLLRFIGKKGFIAKDLIDCGILVQSRSVLYSPFEERILFPIKDVLSRTCGFGGRIFKKEDERAKYYNSKETLWFSKGKLLFGLDLAKNYMQEKKFVFLVEGYTDCVAMAEHGFKNTVATLGTACTSDHFRILSRYVDTVFVLYDGDKAGQNAILRLTQLCWDVNLELKVVILPAKDDPASFLNNGGNLTTLIKESGNIFSFYVNAMGRDFSSKSLQDKITSADKILDLIAKIDDELKREILLQQAGKVLDLPIASLKNLIFGKKAENIEKNDTKFNYEIMEQKTKKQENLRKKEKESSILEERIFSVIINSIDKVDNLSVSQDLVEYFSEYIQFLFKKMEGIISGNKDRTNFFDSFLNSLSDNDREWVINCSLKFDQNIDKKTFNELLILFVKRNWKKIVQDIKDKLSLAKKSQDEKRVKDLFNLFTQLKDGIKSRGLI